MHLRESVGGLRDVEVELDEDRAVRASDLRVVVVHKDGVAPKVIAV